MPAQNKIKVAIAGVGNCASALVQGVKHYRDRHGSELEDVMRRLCAPAEPRAAHGGFLPVASQ